MISIAGQAAGSAPVLVPEFVGVRRYTLRDDPRLLAKIGPGEYYASSSGELITTIVGSCVAACVRNPRTGVAGMNHFLLPDSWFGASGAWENTPVSATARYGNVAMERLINVVMGDGTRRDELEIKIFGGARVLEAKLDIGERNILFVKSYLRTERLRIAAQDVGGSAPRKLIYDTANGDVFLKRLGAAGTAVVRSAEQAHLESLRRAPVSGEVEMFTAGEGAR